MSIIILDAGSGVTKCGHNVDNTPSCVFPTVIGKPRYEKVLHNVQAKDYFVGNEAQRTRGILTLDYPIDRGTVVNWDDLEKVWSYAFHDKLKVNTQDFAVFLTESPLNPNPAREKAVEMMFEKFNVNGLYLGNSSVLSLYNVGLRNGLVIESGHGVTHVVPIYQGTILKYLVARLEIGGKDVTDYLSKLLTESHHTFNGASEMAAVQALKERHAYVAGDNLQREFQLAEATNQCRRTFMLPDDRVVTINTERFECTEILFRPSLVGVDKPGLTETIQSIIKRCRSDVSRKIARNVVLSGGNTMFPGLKNRIRRSVRKRLQSNAKINVVAHPNRQYSAWMGASLFAKSPNFRQLLITPGDYQEYGAAIVHRKCFWTATIAALDQI